MIPTHMIERFMRESNSIEGEFEWDPVGAKVGALGPGDISAVETFLKLDKITQKDILAAHERMFSHRLKSAGSYRTVDVRVGKYVAPSHSVVKKKMGYFMRSWSKMDSWSAHNIFEKIHPFEDGNGRMGRLIWLWKAVKEGYEFELPFLHIYYYQTLSHSRR